MIQSCKYFFVHWNTFLGGKEVDLNLVSSKLWITDELYIHNDIPFLSNYLPTVLTKIYQCDVKVLNIYYQKIYISDLEFLASKCERVDFHEITVINEDESVVGLEKIIEVLPKIQKFVYQFSSNFDGASANVMTSETVKKLIHVSHFSNIAYFYLAEIPEAFDIDTFFDYIKKNNGTNILLRFGGQLSQEYQTRLQTIVNEIISIQNCDYNVPFIYFSGIDLTSSKTLLKLRCRS